MINRNNYEEYFLLLTDNELPAEEAAAVKQFAAQHPDLAEELDILMSCRLEVDSMPSFPKEKLLRTTLWNAESPEPIHTRMLLLLDGELPNAEKQQLQATIAANTALQTEWNTLQQTRLVAETIAHPNKETLRRNGRKVRPLLWMRWAAAAAVVAGLGWWIGLQQTLNGTIPDTVARVATFKQKAPGNVQPYNDTLPQPSANDAQPAQTQQLATTTPLTQTNDMNQPTSPQPTKPKTASVVNTDLAATANPGLENTTEAEPVVTRLSSTDVSLSPGEANMAMQVAHLSTKTVALPVLATTQKMDVFTGSKNELAEEEDGYVTVGGARINKHTMRGLFRNVARTVTRSFSKSKLEPDVYATR